ncbi:MAG: DUF1624 domain-containing protein [Myxococcales bacterium]|nr:DUF1624 domain-containing protein [Myxococcales bacterium]
MTVAKKRARVWFVDVVRLIASFQMINGHTLDVLMVDELRQGPVFERYTFMRGLVSVAFLTVAGLAFHLATLARFDAHRASPTEVKKRFRRAGILLLLGYLLRFPGEGLFGEGAAAAASWSYFFTCGVLQCIGVALFLLEAATVLAKRPQHVVIFAGLCAAFFIGLAPWMHHVPLVGAWRPFTAYLTHAGGSLFPLFPWAGYMFAGCVLGWVTLPEGGTTPLGTAIPRLAGAAVVAGLAWQGLELLGPLGPEDTHHSTHVAFAVQKLASVIGIVLLLAIVTAPLESLPKLLRIVSAETLFVYVFHLWVLYASFLGIEQRWGHQVQLPVALGASVAMMVLTVSATVAWHRRQDLIAALRRGRGTASPTA